MLQKHQCGVQRIRCKSAGNEHSTENEFEINCIRKMFQTTQHCPDSPVTKRRVSLEEDENLQCLKSPRMEVTSPSMLSFPQSSSSKSKRKMLGQRPKVHPLTDVNAGEPESILEPAPAISLNSFPKSGVAGSSQSGNFNYLETLSTKKSYVPLEGKEALKVKLIDYFQKVRLLLTLQNCCLNFFKL